MSLIILNVDEVRRTLSASGGAFVVHDKEVDIVRFAINSGFADIVLDGQVALRVMYQRPGETEVRAQTLTYYDTDGLRNYYDWQLLSADLEHKGTITCALCILRTDSEVEEWHTTPYQIRVLGTIHTDDSDEADESITPTVAQRVAVLESMIQRVASGAPIVVASTSAMTDTDQIYVLKTDGKWYYHNGSAWTAGGEYGAVSTDTTLTQPGMPADAEAVGDAINEVKADLDNNVNDLKSAIDYSFFDFASIGTFSLATISSQTGVANTSANRILLNAFIDVENIKSLSTNANYSLNLFGYGDANESSYIGTVSWTYAGTVYDKETIKTRLPTSKYIRVVFKEKKERTLTLADVVTSEFSLVLSINEKVDKNTSDIQIISESVEKFINTPYIIGSLNQIARLGWMPYAMNMPPEQSIYSYRLAYNKGCRLMLCDLRKTSDGTFVCWHDNDLGGELGNNVVKHTDGTNLSPAEKAQTIASSTIETLDTYDFGIYKGNKYAGLKILRFEDFVKFCSKLNCILVVETKYKLTEIDVQNVAGMIKTANLGDRIIIAEDVTYYPYTHRFWKNNLPKMIIAIRGGSRAYSSAILQAKQCVDGGFKSVISFTSTSGITDEMISDMVDYGISMWFSQLTSESELETFETYGWLNKFKYISSSYVQISKYVESG